MAPRASTTMSSVRTIEKADGGLGASVAMAPTTASSVTTVESWDNGAGGKLTATVDKGSDDRGGLKQKIRSKTCREKSKNKAKCKEEQNAYRAEDNASWTIRGGWQRLDNLGRGGRRDFH